MTATITQPANTTMQSGKAKDQWLLEYVRENSKKPDNLMGWNTMSDMREEIRLRFDTLAEAEAYAKKQGIAYEIIAPNPRKAKAKAYADNFKFSKVSG